MSFTMFIIIIHTPTEYHTDGSYFTKPFLSFSTNIVDKNVLEISGPITLCSSKIILR